jgi:predicted RNase H-like HicB family nuclease
MAKGQSKTAGARSKQRPEPVNAPAVVSNTFMLRIIIHPAEEGGYWAEVPGFPGGVSEGETLEEMRANIREAFTGVFAVMQEDPPTEPGQVEEIPL